MKETSKCYKFREERGYFEKYLVGNGIDIGGGDDSLTIPSGSVFCYDKQHGDAQFMTGVEDAQYDFVYSSHCLEHMKDLNVAIRNWMRICKPGGYLYIVVPHEVYYEQGFWPSKWNGEHSWSFTIDEKTAMPKNVPLKMLFDNFKDDLAVIEIFENLQNYNFDTPRGIDQTYKFEDMVCCQIEAILRRI